jgi:putative endonuclease
MNVPLGAVSSVVEHYNDTVGVTGSIPVLPTILTMYFTYIIQNESSGRFYFGHTDNLVQRLELHNTGQSHYTAHKGPWKLVHAEPFESRSEAMIRESKIKSWKSRRSIQELIDKSR